MDILFTNQEILMEETTPPTQVTIGTMDMDTSLAEQEVMEEVMMENHHMGVLMRER